MTIEPFASPDYSALTAPVSPDEVKQFRLRSRQEKAPWSRRPDPRGNRPSGANRWLALIPIVIFLVIGTFVVSVMTSVARSVLSVSSDAPFPFNLIGVFFLVIGIGFVLIVGLAIVRGLGGFGFPRGWWEAALQLTRFAAANGLEYLHERPAAHSGSIFQVGSARTVERAMRAATGRPTEVGTYRYAIESGSGENRSTTIHRWGYVAIRLDRNLPHMVLDAGSNDRSLFGVRSSNLPVSFDRSQVLHLEGDFDQHFTLYAPKEYERDALYVFTPDLMALLIDETGDFDVEIVDDWMFIYSARPFNLLSPDTYERMRRIVATVGAKTLRQTARYADERVGDPLVNQVAPQGRRLKRRTSVFATVIVVASVLFWLWNHFLARMFGLG